MKNLIKGIIALIAIIIIIIVLVLFILNLKEDTIDSGFRNESNSIENEMVDEETPQDELIQLAQKTVQEKNDYVVFSLNNIIQKLFNYINENNIDAVYNITNTEYINANNMTKQEVMLKYTNGYNVKSYYIQEVYTLQDYEKQIYYTYGLLLGENKITKCYLKIKVNNELFSIEPLNIENYKSAKQGLINIIEDTNIEPNDNNKYDFLYLSSKDIATTYINDFIFKLKYIPTTAYNLLEDEYKNSKFNDISKFKNYIKQNSNRFNNITIQGCNTEIKEDSIHYIVTDETNNYYKIIVYSPMNYKIILGK